MPAALEKRVGPFPIAGWLGIGAAGVGLGLLIRRSGLFSGGEEAPMASYDEDGNLIAGTGGSAPAGYTGVNWPSGTAAPSNAPASSSTVVGAPQVTEETNLEWSRRAITWLIDNARATPANADSGIRNYIEGRPLTRDQLAAVQAALAERTIGPPPEYVPPLQLAEAPDVAPPPPPSPVTPPPVYAAPPASVVPPGRLVSPDGDTVFWTDGNAVEHVKDGNRSIALWRSGAAVKSVVGDPNSPSAYPEPLYMPEASIRSIPHKVGTPPPRWGSW